MTGNAQSLQSFIDTAIVPIDQIGVADLHAGAARFDGWLQEISGGWVTLQRLEQVAGSLPVLGNIMAAVDLCGDVVTMYQQRNARRSQLESTLAWAELGIDLIGSLPAPGTGPARMTLRPTLAVIRQAVKHEVKEIPAAVSAVLANHFSSTLMGEFSAFADGAIKRLEEFLKESAAKIASILAELAKVLRALAAGHLLRPDENLKRAEADLAELRRDPLHQYDKLFSAVWEAYKAGVKSEANAVAELTTGAIGKERMTRAAVWLESMVPVAKREILALVDPNNTASILSMLRILQRAVALYEKHKHPVAATVTEHKPNQAKLKNPGNAVEPAKGPIRHFVGGAYHEV
ncbi:hypothetical protein DM992_12845 [Burkholderia sp. JP2-270]|uniref:hypothetical protein n=1 Tax=Burkholderia sp. JP2-270 TaxID=2217913 RepID=UPI000DA3A07C|nr:hypothetical protein [Burkholderia sp. JP2-270]AWV00322.1 hypothetical protein DM992_12845 [Burkholderia sp. JP2-270]